MLALIPALEYPTICRYQAQQALYYPLKSVQNLIKNPQNYNVTKGFQYLKLTFQPVVMCFTRKFVIVLSVILSIPVLLLAYLAGRFQYQLVRSTYTINEIPRSDPVFSSPAYQRHFGDQEWAKIESFAVAILLPLEAVLPELSENDEAFASEVFRIMWNERSTRLGLTQSHLMN